MIISLQGKITHKDANYIIMEVAGLGYQVFLSEEDLKKIQKESEVKFFTHEYLRENARELYGFKTREELNFFLKLLSISGVGPRTAQNVLSLGLEKIKKAIFEGRFDFLTSISGVGKKTAQKIVIELKGSIDRFERADSQTEQVIGALVNLGYSRTEAGDAVRNLPENVGGIDEQIKAALKMLGKKP